MRSYNFKTHWSFRRISIVLVLCLLDLNSCSYYRVVHGTRSDLNNYVTNPMNSKKFTILHKGDSVWEFTSISMDNENITGFIKPLQGHTIYLNTDPSRPNRYKADRWDKSEVVNEVHMYVYEFSSLGGGKISIPAENISSFQSYEDMGPKYKGLIVIGAIVIIGIAFALGGGVPGFSGFAWGWGS